MIQRPLLFVSAMLLTFALASVSVAGDIPAEPKLLPIVNQITPVR